MAKLFVVATPIGNLGDISERALNALKESDLVISEDTRRTALLLSHFEISKKLVSYHKYSEMQKAGTIIERILEDDITAALVTDAGTPCISDPGSILVKKAYEVGVNVIAIPGASSVTSAVSIAGFEENRFDFYGFFPRTKKEQDEVLRQVSERKALAVIFESPLRIKNMLVRLEEFFPTCELALFNDLSKKFERVYRGEICNVKNEVFNNPDSDKGEYVLVLRANAIQQKEEAENQSIESMLVETMVKNSLSLKDAVNILSENTSIQKKDIYNASLRLKGLFRI